MIEKEIFLNTLNVKITESGCWEWQGKRNTNAGGYGYITIHSKTLAAHRMSWMTFNNREFIPKSMFICHKCDNRCCVNPHHLYLGTPQDNANDRKKRGIKKQVRQKMLDRLAFLHQDKNKL